MRMGRLGRASTAATVIATLVLAGVAPAVAAQDAGGKSAEAYVADAVRAFNLGRFGEASALFEKAYQLDPAPILLFNIGQSERRLGNNERALFFYRRFLAEAPPTAAERKEVEDRVSELERWVREQADLKDRPPPGVGHDLSQPPNKPVVVATPTVPVLRADAAAGTAPPKVTEEGRGPRRPVAWATGGLAAGALVFGTVETILWANAASRFNEHVGPSPNDPNQPSRNCGADAPQRGGPGCEEVYEEVRTSRLLAVSGLAVGGVLGVVSATLFVASTDARGHQVSCAPTVNRSGFGCAFAFAF